MICKHCRKPIKPWAPVKTGYAHHHHNDGIKCGHIAEPLEETTMPKYPIRTATLDKMEGVRIQTTAMSGDTTRLHMQAVADEIITDLPEPLRTQVAAALAPPATWAERVLEDPEVKKLHMLPDSVLTVVRATARLREPELREKLMGFLDRNIAIGKRPQADKELTALIGGTHA